MGLVEVGYIENFDKLREQLKTHGQIPEGQWIMAFKDRYPLPDGQGSIGVADHSWVDSDGEHRFPLIGDDGSLTLLLTYVHRVHFGKCRWLLEVRG